MNENFLPKAVEQAAPPTTLLMIASARIALRPAHRATTRAVGVRGMFLPVAAVLVSQPVSLAAGGYCWSAGLLSGASGVAVGGEALVRYAGEI
ncbi:hypothetical protein KCP70_18065 [Salmonella enterica subsp. enterica]|nr:hypothetical protein KCP70_18065 [Salmonella enterica subsp. enterica]